MADEIEELFSLDHLYRAFLCTRKAHPLRHATLCFEDDMVNGLREIRQQVLGAVYRFGPYRSFIVHDNKMRHVVNAPFADRVVHHVLYKYLCSMFERGFIYDSWGNRQGKGIHGGMQRAAKFSASANTAWVLQTDISKYFFSIRHDRLLEILARRIRCPRLLQLFADLLDSFHTDSSFDALFPADHPYRECHQKGLPLGNLTSQILANIYLDPFDHRVKDALGWRYYVRYVDDMVFWHKDRQQLIELRCTLEKYLRQHFGLLLRPNKTSLFPKQQGLEFLGYRIYPTHCLPRKHNQRKARRLLRVGMTSAEGASWNGYFSHTSAASLWTRRLDFGAS